VRVKLVEDRAVCRIVGESRKGVVDLPDRGRREQVPAVGEGLAHDRAEVAVGDREVPVYGVVEGLVFFLPEAHGHAADDLRGERVNRGPDESVHPAVVECVMAGRPLLARLRLQLARGGHPERVLDPPVGVRVGGGRQAIAADPEAVSAAPEEHPDPVVVGVVLHHDHDDVLNLRDRVSARGQVPERQRPGLPQRPRQGWCRPPCARAGCRADGESRPEHAAPVDAPARLFPALAVLPFVHLNSSRRASTVAGSCDPQASLPAR
jgi:hypothetical protein